MSNSSALALVIASFFVGLIGYYLWTKWAHELAHEIATGVAANVSLPLPKIWRWHLLQTRFVYLVMSMVATAAVPAATSFVTAKLADDPAVKTVAFAFAALSAFAAGGLALHGALEFVQLRKLLRQAEAD